jgi:glycine/D-amino acid oxidase-like deaminating enzyme
VRIATGTAIEGIAVTNGRVTGVQTSRGPVSCRYLVNAAGAHAYHVARLAGLELPIVPVRHEYYITVPMSGLSPALPCFRIPEWTLYGRVRDGGLLLGGWEPQAVHLDPRSYALAGQPSALEPDWAVLQHFETALDPLLPGARGAEKSFVGKGWPTFTPDGRFIIGESCRVRGFVMAGGCNAHGISGSGGIGRLLVESLLDRHPSAYVKSLSPDRFTETAWDWSVARVQAARVYETYYGV